MTKTVFVFVILVLFVAIAVWFVAQKTRGVNKGTETPVVTATPDNGLVIQDIVVGSGKVAENGDTLSAHYIGKLENGTIFDESYDGGQPIQFILGSGQLIKGWELGLIGMKEGGKRRLVIPPELGYGARGAGNGAIPPNAILLFEIELVSIQKK